MENLVTLKPTQRIIHPSDRDIPKRQQCFRFSILGKFYSFPIISGPGVNFTVYMMENFQIFILPNTYGRVSTFKKK